MVRKFAYHNYISISPNLHHRKGLTEREEILNAVREAGGMSDEQCIGDVEGVIKYLETMPIYNGKVGTIGFCSGGRQVYLTACNIDRIDAAVDCYGVFQRNRYYTGYEYPHCRGDPGRLPHGL